MIISTTEEVAGRQVAETLGIARGNVIRAKHIGTDIVAGLRNLVGGEVSEYTKLMAEAREQAMDRMLAQAREMNADAIIGVRFATSMVMSGGRRDPRLRHGGSSFSNLTSVIRRSGSGRRDPGRNGSGRHALRRPRDRGSSKTPCTPRNAPVRGNGPNRATTALRCRPASRP